MVKYLQIFVCTCRQLNAIMSQVHFTYFAEKKLSFVLRFPLYSIVFDILIMYFLHKNMNSFSERPVHYGSKCVILSVL